MGAYFHGVLISVCGVFSYTGAYFCMGAYKRRCGCGNQNGCQYSWVPIFMGCLFVPVLIIPILRYAVIGASTARVESV